LGNILPRTGLFRQIKKFALLLMGLTAAGFLSSGRAKRSSRRESRFARFFEAKNIELTSNPDRKHAGAFFCPQNEAF
jgi:hypothetical protein